jgi:hypothetical protein
MTEMLDAVRQAIYECEVPMMNADVRLSPVGANVWLGFSVTQGMVNLLKQQVYPCKVTFRTADGEVFDVG